MDAATPLELGVDESLHCGYIVVYDSLSDPTRINMYIYSSATAIWTTRG